VISRKGGGETGRIKVVLLARSCLALAISISSRIKIEEDKSKCPKEYGP
jgi:hypothetical protein